MSGKSREQLGFWPVFGLVVGSQIGSAVFLLPNTLAPYGLWALAGWCVSGLGAICLALVFARLCEALPRTGGPHVYVSRAFGGSVGFFVGWLYWVVSWVSTTTVIVTGIGYLSGLLFDGHTDPSYANLALEIGLFTLISWMNLKGVAMAGRAEFGLTLLKSLPLLILPLMALPSFDRHHFVLQPHLQSASFWDLGARVTLITLWGFVGLESATTPAGSVYQPQKTIPRAVVWGTFSVALLYGLNSIGIMGALPGSLLGQSKAPYGEVARLLLGHEAHLVVSLIAALVCLGTLNAWVLSAGQIALGLSEDRLLPPIFGLKNRHGAPWFSILLSYAGTLPLLCLLHSERMGQRLSELIDVSATAFLMVYLASVLAWYVLACRKQEQGFLKTNGIQWAYATFALVFCLWTLLKVPLEHWRVLLFFVGTGLPFYCWKRYG